MRGRLTYNKSATREAGSEGLQNIRQIFLLPSVFIHRNTEYERTAAITTVRTLHNEIGTDVTGEMKSGHEASKI